MSDAYKTIITAQEVIYYTPQTQGHGVDSFRHMIPLKEEGLFNVWLGLDWYAALLEDLEDHTGFSHFQEATNYTTDTVVLWRDMLYKVTATPNSGGSLPSDSTKWVEAPKFKTEQNNYLWQRYLRTVLAWHIMHTAMVYTAIKQTALGVVQAGVTEKQQPVRGRTLASFKSEIGQDFNSFLQTMDAYLRKNSSTFALYKPNLDACNQRSQVGKRSQDYGFTF